jgi:ABC-type uncharacterized transport system involved in gliding motility auxiliary subunit
MDINPKSRLQLRLQNITFVILLLLLTGLLAYVSQQHSAEFDWTRGQRNTLAQASVDLLQTLDKPIHVTVYATETETIRKPIEDLLSRYQRVYPQMEVEYVNPELEPALVRERGITTNGELVLQYAGRSQRLNRPNEQSFTNALQSLARSERRWLVFLSGHGERSPQGKANFDLSDWVSQLEDKGLRAQSHNLTEHPKIPDNTAVLVIAGPQVDLLPGEVDIIKQYVTKGGNLLWLTDPGSLHGLGSLAKQLGIEFLPGTIVDPTTRVFGISDPRFAIVPEYPAHAITQNFSTLTLYPQARGLKIIPDTDSWKATPIMVSLQRSWAETGPLSGQIEFNAGSDIKGPLIVGAALQRSLTNNKGEQVQQRVFVVGDGDFLSNAYLGNGGNLDLGLHIVNWLSHDDRLIAIPAKTAPDISLELSAVQEGMIAFGFLLLLPLLLLGTGVTLWWKRRKR